MGSSITAWSYFIILCCFRNCCCCCCCCCCIFCVSFFLLFCLVLFLFIFVLCFCFVCVFFFFFFLGGGILCVCFVLLVFFFWFYFLCWFCVCGFKGIYCTERGNSKRWCHPLILNAEGKPHLVSIRICIIICNHSSKNLSLDTILNVKLCEHLDSIHKVKGCAYTHCICSIYIKYWMEVPLPHKW